MKNDVIKLCSATYEKDTNGVLRETVTESDSIMAEIKSAGAEEWFEGGRNGLNPEYTFIINRLEYNSEETVIFNEVKYSVYRTYIKGDRIELHCEKRKGA